MPEENGNTKNSESVVNKVADDEKVKGKTPKKKKKSVIFGIIKYTFIFLIFIVFSLIVLLQTTFFKTWLLDIALSKINDDLVKPGNSIYAESLEGNIISGIKLKNAGIVVQKDTLVKFDYLDAGYNIFKLLDQEIYLNNLILENPEINFTYVWDPELEDGKAWNFTQIFKSEPDTLIDTTVSEFDWGITVDNFELRNGKFRSVDSSNIPIREVSMQELDSFNFGYLDVTDLNIKLSGKYFPEYREADIENISFNTNSDFDLKQLSMKAVLNDVTGSRINNFVLITNRTNLRINDLFVSEFSPLNGFDYEEFGEKNVQLKLLADKFDFRDLIFFLPSLDFLAGRVYLDLDVEDKYKNLRIEKLILKTDNSTYNFTGRIQNLQNPTDLIYDVVGRDMSINPVDTKTILPGLPIPDYSHVGLVTIPYIEFKGEHDDFDAQFDVRTALGNANGDVFLNFEGNEFVYRGNVKTENLNIGRIIKNSELESNINGEVIADGRGFDYRTMNTRVNYDIRNTTFFKQNITSSAGQINMNGGNAQLDITFVSNSVNAKVRGNANVRNLDNITYDLQGVSNDLNIAGFTGDATQNSDLNFTFDIKGVGFDPNTITGQFNFDIQNSRYAEFIIPQTPLQANLQREGDEKILDLRSDIIDISAKGKFGFTQLGNVLGENISQIVDEYSKRFTAIADTTDTLSYNPDYDLSSDLDINKYVTTTSSAGADLDMRYSITFKNLLPLSNYIDSTLFIKGTITGTIKNENNIFNLTAQADIRDFVYGDSLLIFKDTDIFFNMENNPTLTGLNGYSSDFRIVSDSLVFAKQMYDSINVDIHADDQYNKYRMYALKDTNFIVYSDGYLSLLPGKIELTSDTTAFKYKVFSVSNRDTVRINYLNTGDDQLVEFKSFTLQKENQRVAVKGIFSLEKESDLEISGDNINITSIELFQNPETRETEEITGNIRRVKAIVKGPLDNLNIVAEVNSDPLYISMNPIGRFDAEIIYKDNIIFPDISFYNANNKGNLQIYGTFPIPSITQDSVVIANDSIQVFDTTYTLDTLDLRSVDLTVDANNFQLDILSRYVPNLSRISGGLDGEIRITGNVSEPDLIGDLSINEGRFVFDMTKMYYGLNMKFTANNEKLEISNMRVFVPSEPSKFLSGYGSLDLSNLQLSDIDMTMEGTIKALDNDNGPTDFGIYGDLYVGSGTPKLKVTGNQQKILISGNLLLIEGNVTMNPLGAKTYYDVYDDEGFVYTVEIDSSTIDQSMIEQIKAHVEKINAKNEANVTPFQRYFLPVDSLANGDTTKRSVLAYDLTMQNQNELYLRFIVNEQTRQEFFGNVNVDLQVNNLNEKNTMSAIGTVTLGNNAYYRFYRRFDATGDIRFYGPVTNPELNVTAEFSTVSSSSSVTSGTSTYRVVLHATGSATSPKLDFQVYENGNPVGGADPTSAAISVILFGQLNPGGGLLGSVGSNIGSLVVSDYLSSAIQDVLPFIVNTSINYNSSESGNVVQNTDLSLTAQFGDATVKFGGQVFEDISNSTIVIEYPLNKLLNLNLPSNLILQIERVVDPTSSLSTDGDEFRTGALIYYRIKF